MSPQANYRSVKENPCHMCMPMGGILAFKGVEGAMVLVHGSQGCSTYMRRHIAEHFNEPVDVASTCLNEKGTVYGGEEHLLTGLDNLVKVYCPKLVGVLTTCLAETIGEDVNRMVTGYVQKRGAQGVPVVAVSTPGYGGSHYEGYFLTLIRILEELTEKSPKHGKVNVIVPNVSPADIREIKRIFRELQVDATLFPDISDTLDGPFARPYHKIPAGGTSLADIAAMGGAEATIQFGVTMDEDLSPGKYLENRFGVPLFNLPIPMGLQNTDAFFAAIKDITGKSRPQPMEWERGRLLDAMIDSHKYNGGGRSVIYGDPELVLALMHICMENGIFPAVMATGGKAARLVELAKEQPGEIGEILQETDFSIIRMKAVTAGVNLAIGSSDGRYLTEREGIPLVRIGYPIHDRVGGQRLLSVGYTGTAMLLDRLTNTLLENKYKHYRGSLYRQYFCSH